MLFASVSLILDSRLARWNSSHLTFDGLEKENFNRASGISCWNRYLIASISAKIPTTVNTFHIVVSIYMIQQSQWMLCQLKTAKRAHKLMFLWVKHADCIGSDKKAKLKLLHFDISWNSLRFACLLACLCRLTKHRSETFSSWIKKEFHSLNDNENIWMHVISTIVFMKHLLSSLWALCKFLLR